MVATTQVFPSKSNRFPATIPRLTQPNAAKQGSFFVPKLDFVLQLLRWLMVVVMVEQAQLPAVPPGPTAFSLFSARCSSSLQMSLARFPWGSKSIAETPQTVQKDSSSYLQLFEFEAFPFCRRVREAMTGLDLSAEIYPCLKGSKRHQELVKKMGGKEQFPFLVDPISGISMYESGEIVKYLFQQYGRGRKLSFGLLESTFFTGWVPTILRAVRCMTLWEVAKTDPPSQMLGLFSYENNPRMPEVHEKAFANWNFLMSLEMLEKVRKMLSSLSK